MVLMETVIFMGVLISCAILLHATLDIEGTEVGEERDDFSHVRQADLANITNMAEEISKFIGEVLLGYLMYHATTTPKVIRNIFFKKAIVFVSGVINNGPIVVALVVGSLASLRVMRTNEFISCTENLASNGSLNVLYKYLLDQLDFRSNIISKQPKTTTRSAGDSCCT